MHCGTFAAPTLVAGSTISGGATLRHRLRLRALAHEVALARRSRVRAAIEANEQAVISAELQQDRATPSSSHSTT